MVRRHSWNHIHVLMNNGPPPLERLSWNHCAELNPMLSKNWQDGILNMMRRWLSVEDLELKHLVSRIMLNYLMRQLGKLRRISIQILSELSIEDDTTLKNLSIRCVWSTAMEDWSLRKDLEFTIKLTTIQIQTGKQRPLRQKLYSNHNLEVEQSKKYISRGCYTSQRD